MCVNRLPFNIRLQLEILHSQQILDLTDITPFSDLIVDIYFDDPNEILDEALMKSLMLQLNANNDNYTESGLSEIVNSYYMSILDNFSVPHKHNYHISITQTSENMRDTVSNNVISSLDEFIHKLLDIHKVFYDDEYKSIIQMHDFDQALNIENYNR